METAPVRSYVPARTVWADMLGYSRAVRDGDRIWVSATAPANAQGDIVGVGDPGRQTAYVIGLIEQALTDTGAMLADVVRTRIYIRSFDDLESVGAAHRAAFATNPPACTVVAVADLVHPDMRVYIEAEAITHAGTDVGRHEA